MMLPSARASFCVTLVANIYYTCPHADYVDAKAVLSEVHTQRYFTISPLFYCALFKLVP